MMILLTGAAGSAGRRILAALAQADIEVRALVRSEARQDSLPTPRGVDVIVADMSAPTTCEAALDGIDAVLLISTADEHMAQTQMSFVDAAKAAGVGGTTSIRRGVAQVAPPAAFPPYCRKV
jgi:uncharacterized protein YbjT (DUF2867 family)